MNRGKSPALALMVGLVTILQTAGGSVRLCGNPIPGITIQSRGVDVTMLDLTPQEFTGSDGFRSPVFTYTCNDEKTLTQRGVQYDVPDQVWQVNHVPGGWVSSEVKIFKDYKEIKRTMSSDVSGGLMLEKFGFSASSSYARMQHTITNTSSFIEQVSSFDSAIRNDLVPFWVLELGPIARGFVDNVLPSNYSENPAAYKRFIRYFGTHYFQSARFGGLIKLVLETSTDYFENNDDRKVQEQAEASFLNLLQAKGGYSGSVNTVEQRFEDLTTKTTRYYGGNTNLLSSSGIEQWQPTVAGQPWLFSGELAPISELIRNDTKKASMEVAVSSYILHSHLDELLRLLNARRESWTAGLGSLHALVVRVQAMRQLDLLEQGAVEALGNEVEDEITTPPWFTQRTKFCYQWYPDGDGGQCGGGADRLLCALPGKMTSYYRDDTDRRGGGCRMQWGLTTSREDPWFRQVQVCFRWAPDGDAGQCGGGVGRELCAPVNSYTPYYRDDTDRRSGGCQMSWRLVVPVNAPAWALNLQLCYVWYPDGVSGQCGGGASRNLCARANEWTANYRDDTDSRAGGCQMSWGIKLD